MMKQSKKMTWTLAILVLAIWGTVAHQLVDAVGLTSAEPIEEAVHVRDNIVLERFVYEGTQRDPFYLAIKRDVRRDTSKKTSAPLPSAAFKLTGILTGGKKRTAIVESKNGETFFLNEGDTLRGIKLLRINTSTVLYSFERRKLEWSLTQGS